MEISINLVEFSLNSRFFFAKLKDFFAKLKNFPPKLKVSEIPVSLGAGKSVKNKPAVMLFPIK